VSLKAKPWEVSDAYCGADRTPSFDPLAMRFGSGGRSSSGGRTLPGFGAGGIGGSDFRTGECKLAERRPIDSIVSDGPEPDARSLEPAEQILFLVLLRMLCLPSNGRGLHQCRLSRGGGNTRHRRLVRHASNSKPVVVGRGLTGTSLGLDNGCRCVLEARRVTLLGRSWRHRTPFRSM
jgi:hypothetical protein